MDKLHKHLFYIVILTVIVMGIETHRSGFDVDWKAASEVILKYGTAVSAVAFAVWLFDHTLWTWPLIHGLFAQPNLNGTWRARLEVYRAGAVVETLGGFMVVRQSYLSCSMRLVTEQAQSRLRLGELLLHPDGTHSFSCIYHCTPHAAERWSNPNDARIHRGAMLLSVQTQPKSAFEALIHGPTVERLIGEFWTDLGTLGTIELIDRRPVQVDSYESAATYYQTP